MIRVNVDGVSATVTEKEILTAGRVGLECAFTFAGEWDGLFKTAVFQGVESVDVALPDNTCIVPWEAMQVEGVQLKIGVYGANGEGTIVIPTVWANAGKIQPSAIGSGTEPSEPSQNANAYAVETAEEAKNIALSVQQRADNGEFIGPQGPTGQTGPSGVYIGESAPADPDVDVWIDTDGDPDSEIYTTAEKAKLASLSVSAQIPQGGATGQVLKKASGTDYDTEWADESGGGGSTEIFLAVYGTTSVDDIETAYQAGKTILCEADGALFSLPSGSTISLPLYARVESKSFVFTSSFNDSSNGKIYTVTVNLADGWLHSSKAFPIPQVTGTPEPLGTANMGSSAQYSRKDHVHAMPTAAQVGAYEKPSGGIPATDLASAVRTSLGKADTALQSAHEVPSGGDSGYVLSKASNTDYDLAWVAQSGGGGSIDPYTSTPADLGTASAGSSDDYARGDHVHKMPSASDVGAIAAPGSPSAGDVLTYSSGAWAAAAPEHQIPSGGNAGECLAKNSATNYDLRWRTINDWTPAGLMRTNGGTAAKVAEWSFWSATQYPSWLVVTVGNSNTYAGAITLKVNGSTAYPIYINGVASSATNYTLPAGSYFVYFDGSKFDFRTDGKIPGDITGHAGGDIAAPASPTTGDFLCWNGSAWAATSMSAWQGGNY